MSDYPCNKCGFPRKAVFSPCPDGMAGCAVAHWRYEPCVFCAKLAARDAEWRAAVEKVWVRISGDHIGGEYPEGCAALDALLREVPHDGQ